MPASTHGCRRSLAAFTRFKHLNTTFKRAIPTVVVSLSCVVIGSAAVDGLFTVMNQIGRGPRVCQPRVVTYVASQHAGPAETFWKLIESIVHQQ